MAKFVLEVVRFLSKRHFIEDGGPILIKLITKIAARFSISVSHKFAVQALPVLGAFGGASINVLFMGHFQDIARGHFTVRRLERQYGAELVAAEYQRLHESTLIN